MFGALKRTPELGLIVSLCRELARFGVNVDMSGTVPAVLVPPRILGSLGVTVDKSRHFSEWLEVGDRYATSSPVQATMSIAEAVKASGDIGTE